MLSAAHVVHQEVVHLADETERDGALWWQCRSERKCRNVVCDPLHVVEGAGLLVGLFEGQPLLEVCERALGATRRHHSSPQIGPGQRIGIGQGLTDPFQIPYGQRGLGRQLDQWLDPGESRREVVRDKGPDVLVRAHIGTGRTRPPFGGSSNGNGTTDSASPVLALVFDDCSRHGGQPRCRSGKTAWTRRRSSPSTAPVRDR